MSFQVGDVVHTRSGKLYKVRSLYTNPRGDMATLAPLKPGAHRRHATAAVSSLTLVRSAQLTAAFGYAADSEHEAAPEWMRDNARKRANHWLTQAEQRGDDSRAALALGTDRLLHLEESCAS